MEGEIFREPHTAVRHSNGRADRLARLAREESARPLWTPEAIFAEIRLLAIAELQRTGRFEVPGLGTFRVERRPTAREGRRPRFAPGLVTSAVVAVRLEHGNASISVVMR